MSEAYWLVRAPVPISVSRGSHGGLLGGSIRERLLFVTRPLCATVTLHRPSCGVGALPLTL